MKTQQPHREPHRDHVHDLLDEQPLERQQGNLQEIGHDGDGKRCDDAPARQSRHVELAAELV